MACTNISKNEKTLVDKWIKVPEELTENQVKINNHTKEKKMRKKIVPDEIGTSTFMHMKENMTTIPHGNLGSYNTKSLKSYGTYLLYSWQTCQ